MKSWSVTVIGMVLILWTAVSGLTAEPPATFQVSAFSFDRPASWEWVKTTSMMRKAELRVVEEKSGARAEIIFFHFGPGDGGGTQANVERWFRMFREPRDQIQARSETRKVGGHEVTYVQAQGTYMSGMPGGPQTPLPDHALVGAILESDAGNVFVRMTGPKTWVTSLEPEFRKMIESGLQ
jgi:hypothetical protein